MYANGGVLNTAAQSVAVPTDKYQALEQHMRDQVLARGQSLIDSAHMSFSEMASAAERAHQACSRALEDATMRKAAAEEEIGRLTQLTRVAEAFLKTLREGPR